jgi:hypothetical protein
MPTNGVRDAATPTPARDVWVDSGSRVTAGPVPSTADQYLEIRIHDANAK